MSSSTIKQQNSKPVDLHININLCFVLEVVMFVFLGLEVDGIYRVSGNLATIQKLRFLVDQGQLNTNLFFTIAKPTFLQTFCSLYSCVRKMAAPAPNL